MPSPTPAGSSSSTQDHARRARRAAIVWAGLMVFLTVAYYQGRPLQANAATQYALTAALSERQTFRIDAYWEREPFRTIDIAFKDGHFYSDKSPVASMLAVPAFTLYRWLWPKGADGLDYYLGHYFATLGSAGLCAVLYAMLAAAALMRRGIEPRRAALGAALWFAATPMLGYSVFLYGYMPAGLLLLAAHELAANHLKERGLRNVKCLLAAGVLLGLSAWTLNTCALGAGIIAAAVALSALGGGLPWQSQAKNLWRRLWPLGIGLAAGVSGYFIYNRAVFGAFGSPYRYEYFPQFREAMSHGFMGAGKPGLKVLWLITFHLYHGLFIWFPLTTLAAAGALRVVFSRAAARGPRIEAAAALLFLAGLLAYNAGYFMWWGGQAYAPRHLIPGLMLLWAGLLPWLEGQTRRRWVVFCLGLGLFSALLNMAAVANTPQPAPGLPERVLLNPSWVLQWPCIYLSVQWHFWIDNVTSPTLGDFLGLRGRGVIVPLIALWLCGTRWLFRAPATAPTPRA